MVLVQIPKQCFFLVWRAKREPPLTPAALSRLERIVKSIAVVDHLLNLRLSQMAFNLNDYPRSLRMHQTAPILCNTEHCTKFILEDDHITLGRSISWWNDNLTSLDAVDRGKKSAKQITHDILCLVAADSPVRKKGARQTVASKQLCSKRSEVFTDVKRFRHIFCANGLLRSGAVFAPSPEAARLALFLIENPTVHFRREPNYCSYFFAHV